jgi:uncharacterized protein YbaP (TraB family)
MIKLKCDHAPPLKKETGLHKGGICILIGLLFSILLPEALSQTKKNFLWKVRSKTNTVYVLGSIHYLKKDVYPLDESIEKAFDQSDVLVVEANIGDVKKADIQKLLGSAFYPENDTLEKHISQETLELLKKELGNLGLPLEAVSKQKPWFLAMTLASLEILKLGFDPNYGIDKYFLSKAAGTKKILELESLDYQINLFSKFSGKEQELLLLLTLQDIRVLEQELDKLVKAWASGDDKGLESIIRRSVGEDKRLVPIYEKLIDERNRSMVSKIEGYLKTKKTYLVIVGAGHLVGRQGIIELLKGKGFSVEQL